MLCFVLLERALHVHLKKNIYIILEFDRDSTRIYTITHFLS